MVLHLLADPDYDPIESEDIRLLPEDPKAKPPLIHDWAADTKEQTITHTSSGCQFRAIRMKPPLVNGLSLPFGHSEAVQRLPSATQRAESRPGRIGPISLDMKRMGERNAGNPHVAFDVEGAGNVARPTYFGLAGAPVLDPTDERVAP